jgi:hypothetical protein
MALDFPNSPTVGQLFPSPPVAGTPVWRWDGTEWVSTGSVGSSAIIYVQDSAPVGAAQNSLWWNSATGQLFIYYNDGNSTQWVFAALGTITPVVRSYLAGLGLSTAGSSATFSVASGIAADSTNADMLNLPAAISKTTGAWTVGNNGGGLDTGTIAATNAWYHVYVIKRPDTQVVDACVSLSAAGPTLGGGGYIPANYTVFRRIGSMVGAGSGWLRFIQDGDLFSWGTPIQDVNVVNPGTAAVTRTLSTPLGVRVQANVTVSYLSSALSDNPAAILLSDLSAADVPPGTTTSAVSHGSYSGATTGSSGQGGGPVSVMTNTSSQIRSRIQISAASTNLYIVTLGWVDRRGRDN